MRAPGKIDPAQILAAMRQGVTYIGTIEIRGFKLSVRPLSQKETLQLYADVAQHVSTLPERARNSITEHAVLARKTLVLASTSDPDKMDFQLTDEVLEQVTNDELTFLFKQYCLAVERVNPAWEALPDETVDALIDEVKKNPPALIDLSSLQMINVCRRLLSGSPMDS